MESFVEGHGDRYTDLLGGTATRRTHGEDVMPRVAASPIGAVCLSPCPFLICHFSDDANCREAGEARCPLHHPAEQNEGAEKLLRPRV